MTPEKLRGQTTRRGQKKRKSPLPGSSGTHPARSPVKSAPPSPFPYVVRRAAPTVRHRVSLERGEGVRAVERRFQRLADEWGAELCLVLTERRAIYFTPGAAPSESSQLPPAGRWTEPAPSS